MWIMYKIFKKGDHVKGLIVFYNYNALWSHHNIIQIHNNILLDWQYIRGIFPMYFPRNIVIDLKNVMSLYDNIVQKFNATCNTCMSHVCFTSPKYDISFVSNFSLSLSNITTSIFVNSQWGFCFYWILFFHVIFFPICIQAWHSSRMVHWTC